MAAHEQARRAVRSCDVLALVKLTEMSDALTRRASAALTRDTFEHMLFVVDLGRRMSSSHAAEAAEAVIVATIEHHSSDADLGRAFRDYFSLARECARPR